MTHRSSFNVPGGYEAQRQRLHELASHVTPHTPATFPTPGADHYARLAEMKRREADSITRHIRAGDEGPAARFARKQVQGLLKEADEFQALAEGGAAQ
jgi:hypothetical protein